MIPIYIYTHTHIHIHEHDITQVYLCDCQVLDDKRLEIPYYFENKGNFHYENEVEVHVSSKSYEKMTMALLNVSYEWRI